MPKPFKTGLTVGKFAPFHNGHQFLIESSLKEVDKLFVIVYDAPKHTHIPLTVRANWIRMQYPEVTVIEGWHVPTDIGWTDEIQQKHVDFIIELLDGQEIDVFFSSEAYGFRMSHALNAENRIVDIDRKEIHVTGTDIRNNPFANRNFVPPAVYNDFITKVAFLGYNRKMTYNLVKKLSDIYQTELVTPYDDDFMVADIGLGLHKVATEIKSKTSDANQFLFIQAGLYELNLNYRQRYHVDHPEFLNIQADHMLQPDVVFIVMSEDTIENRKLIGEFQMRNLPYIALVGNMENQLIKVDNILKLYKKFTNPLTIEL